MLIFCLVGRVFKNIFALTLKIEEFYMHIRIFSTSWKNPVICRLWVCIPPWQTSAGAEKQLYSFTRQTPSSLPQSSLLPLVRLTLRPNPVPTSNYPRSRLFHSFILHALCLWPCESMTPNRALQRNFISVISFNSYHNLMKKVVFILPVLSIRKLKLKEKWRQWEKCDFHLGLIIPSCFFYHRTYCLTVVQEQFYDLNFGQMTYIIM